MDNRDNFEREGNRYGYDANKGKCVLFEYGGCKGNANNFETRRDCKMKCMKKIGRMTTPAVTGEDPEVTEISQGFDTTFAPQQEGFESTLEPRVTAGPVEATSQIQTDPCQMNLDKGPCRAIMRRYGYDATKGKCVRFEYGGCGGNENNFTTRRDCKQQCLKKTR
ncbi:unnamed protein product [Heligmosomoides polygyrus]|uniref:Kunitz/Bovine pancreatic trypsin inhibitor domain protein n=1 Tax=Heligmosomoides polygyrus TaxID=6339 RepID=A0A183G181_HELPZ|nr:unnamed protein product [Heligmosomoides polygyrus]